MKSNNNKDLIRQRCSCLFVCVEDRERVRERKRERESEYIHTRECVFVRVLEIGNIMFWLNEIKK